ncbi:MAG: HypC/HybG/HupF family hydrogenase formation chaperone [Actinomycetota bacterium]|nr:MAG: hydrogenase expression/formation protein [Actinomycetota bacterium]MDO8949880.1 HypC/HybG/HupF family hydrogenase formation chaperone [Actinomycetota bacterium]MDP3629462.1 HypC/HybG/HupF family hydrogenase formation chaperone [Actinomycetota bacterium]
MCLGIPAKIVDGPNDNQMAEADILGVRRWVSIHMVPEAKQGDFVLVHAGFALEIISEQFAAETLELFRQMEMPGTEHLEPLEMPELPTLPALQ